MSEIVVLVNVSLIQKRYDSSSLKQDQSRFKGTQKLFFEDTSI